MGAVQTVPYKVPNHYASESNLMYEKRFDGNESVVITGDENLFEREYHQQDRRQHQQQQHRGGSSESRGSVVIFLHIF